MKKNLELLVMDETFVTVNFLARSYMILAPAAMQAESDPKKSAAACFDSIGLDPDSYRIGHTKAS